MNLNDLNPALGNVAIVPITLRLNVMLSEPFDSPEPEDRFNTALGEFAAALAKHENAGGHWQGGADPTNGFVASNDVVIECGEIEYGDCLHELSGAAPLPVAPVSASAPEQVLVPMGEVLGLGALAADLVKAAAVAPLGCDGMKANAALCETAVLLLAKVRQAVAPKQLLAVAQ